jgi:hypothetical protein
MKQGQTQRPKRDSGMSPIGSNLGSARGYYLGMNVQTQMPAPRRGPILLLVVMVVLFVALLTQVLKFYEDWKAGGSFRKAESQPAAATRPADSRPVPPDGGPQESSFASRNLEWSGNLTLLQDADGKMLQLGDAEHRMAETVKSIPGDRFGARATQMPDMKELLAHPEVYRGRIFTIRIVPFEINDHTNDIPAGRVLSWRIYGMLQRNLSEYVVFETIEQPPMREWLLKRDVVEIDAVFLRSASYKTEKNKDAIVPYFIPKNYYKIYEESDTGKPSVFQIITSKWGPVVLGGILLFAGLFVWTLRRHNRQMERLEKEQFYRLLKDRKRPLTNAHPPRHANVKPPA